MRWLKPVYPGDTLTVRGKIIEKTPSRSKPEIGSFRTQTIVTNQDDVPVMRFMDGERGNVIDVTRYALSSGFAPLAM